MVGKTLSLFIAKGEKIGFYLLSRKQLHVSVWVLDVNDDTFSSCRIVPDGKTFYISDVEEGQVHQLSQIYRGEESMNERNSFWWDLCFFRGGQRLSIDDYYCSLPFAEHTSCTIGQFLSWQSDLLRPFSCCRGGTVFVTGKYASVSPFLYQLQEVLVCSLCFATETGEEQLVALPENKIYLTPPYTKTYPFRIGRENSRTVYIPATHSYLQIITDWGIIVNDLIPGERSVEENCLLPTYACGNCHYILLKIWLESDCLQNLYLCTLHPDTSVKKTIVWKH